jgi:uncharacterized membrane protein
MEDAVIDGAAARRTLDAGRGTAWWRESWALFMKNPGMWLIFAVICFVGSVVLSFIPFLGGLVLAVVTQVIIAGWMLGARKLESGRTLEVGDLFSGFKEKLNPLLALGAIALVSTIVIVAVMGVLGAGAFFGMIAGGSARSSGSVLAAVGVGLVALLVGLILGCVFAIAFWFAPALVALRDVAPVDSLKQSWSAVLSNVGAFVVYGLLWILAAIVASIPLGLGWILLGPLTMLGMYVSYRDIFEGR